MAEAFKPVRALGLMSGTSLDGIDAALIVTDGETVSETGAWATTPYAPALRDRLRAALGAAAPPADLARDLTDIHAAAVDDLLLKSGLSASDIDVIGFHGHTVWHDPAHRVTRQIGDGARLASLTGIDVVDDFRSADVAAGGQGAPFAPLYHRALAEALERPLAVLNLGGVGNVTWIGAGGDAIAFDTGPANALIDDWVAERTGEPFDRDGRLAAAGHVDRDILAALLDNGYFGKTPPKSLDRLDFSGATVAGCSVEDGAATLTAFTVEAVRRALPHLPQPPRRWLVTGGGRHNPTLMGWLAEALAVPVEPVERCGWNGDALEAQAFAFLAVRSLRGLPLSLPSTTGVPAPMTGGRFHDAGAPRRAAPG